MQNVSTRRTVASESSRKTVKALMVAAVAAASVTALGTNARADHYVNTGSSANLLNTAAAWNDIDAVHAGPPGSADFAVWSNASGISTDTTFTLGLLSVPTWNQIQVTDVGANVTVSNDANSLGLVTGIDMSSVSNGHNNFSFLDTIALNGAGQVFNVAANRTLTLGGVALNGTTLTFGGAGNFAVTGALVNGSGAGSVIQNTTGTVVLTGTNAYTGSYTLNAGTVDINSAGAMGGATSSIVITGGTIDNTSNGTITLGAQTQKWTNGFTFGGSTSNLSLGTGTATILSNITVTTNGNKTLTEAGIITDASAGFSLTKTGTGTFVMSGTNAYIGNTTVNQGYLQQNNQNTAATTANATIVIAGGIFGTGSDSVLLQPISFQGGTLELRNFTSAHNFTSKANLTLGAANGTPSVLGNVTTGIISGTLGEGLVYNGPGSLTLGGNNTFNGQTVVNAGTLIQNLPNNNSNITINAGGYFGIPNDAALGNETITWNTGTLQFDNYTTTKNFANVTNLALGAANGTPSNFNGNITGNQGLVYNGPGSLVLTNAQIYSGATIVNQGVLVQNFADNNSSIVLNAPGALAINNDAAVGTEVITFGGGALQFNNYVSNLTFPNKGLVTLGANVGGFSTLAGAITGNTSLTFAGPGSLSLTGANNYTGPTTLQGGALLFGGFNNIGNGTAINFTGGTLLYTPGNTTDITTRTVTTSNTTFGTGGTIDINGNNVTFNNPVSGNGSLSAQDSQSLISTHTFTINANMTYTGATGVNGGAVVLLNEAAGPVLAGGPLVIGGGHLIMDIGASFSNVTQTFSSTTVGAGSGIISTNATGVGVPIINLGAITQQVGGIVEFIGPATIGASGNVPATAQINTTSGSVNGLFASGGGQMAYATVGLYDLATKDPTNTFIVGGSASPGFWTFTPAQAGTQIPAGGNLDVAAQIGANGFRPNQTAFNSFRFNQPGPAFIQTSNAVTTGGQILLVTPNVGANAVSIIGSTGNPFVASRNGTAPFIALVQNDVLGSLVFVGNGLGASKTSPAGLLTSGPGLILLNQASQYTGNTYLEGGPLEISSASSIGVPANAGTLFLDGGSLVTSLSFAMDNGNATTNPRPIQLLGGGGSLVPLTNVILTIDGVISGNGGTLNIGAGQIVGTGAGTSQTTAQFGNGTVIFSGANTYTGNTNVINGATLQLDSNAGTGRVTAGNADGSTTGTITGNGSNLTNKVTINSGSLFNPGHAGIGAIAVNSLTLGSDGIGGDPLGGATIDFSLAKAGNVTSVNNQLSLAANGSMIFNGTNFINLFASGTTSPDTNSGTFILANLNGAATSGLSNTTFTVADSIPNTTYVFSITSGKLQVVINSNNTNGVWAADASGTWSNSGGDAANWVSSIVPGTTGSTASFPGNLGATPVVVTLGAPETFGGMVFGTLLATTPTTYTINGSGANGLTVDLGATNNGGITVGGGTNTINANITLAGTGVAIGVNNDTVANQTAILNINGIIKDNGQHANVSATGTGTVILTAANTYGGSTNIGAGATIQIGNGGTTGSASNGTINNNGTLIINRSDGTIASPYLFNNVISASSAGGLTINGTGVVRPTQVNAFGGTVTINGGVLQVGAVGAVTASTAPSSIGRGDSQSKIIIGAAGKLDLNGFSMTFGSISGAGNIDNSSATPVTLNEGLFPLSDTISGTISNSGGGALSIVKSGAGTLTLSGNNTYTGNTSIPGGNLRLNTNTAAGIGGTIINSGTGTFALLLANGTTISNNYLISGGGANDSIDSPDANSTATFAGAFSVSGSSQLRVGTSGTTGTLILTGTSSLGGAPIIILTTNNVTFAGNGSMTANGTSIITGRQSNAATFNLVLNDNSFINSGGMTLAGGGTVGSGDRFVNVTLNNNASLSEGTNAMNLNNGDAAVAATVNFTMNGNTTLTANALVMGGTNQGATTLNFNGGTIIATGGDTATTHFFPDFTLAATTTLANATVTTQRAAGLVTANIQAGGLKINDGGFNVSIDMPLLGPAGGGGLTKLGTGTVTLNGNNQYLGVTTVSAGTLFANNVTSNSATGFNDVNVAANATFGGLGIIAGNINTLGDGAGLSPGFLGNVGNLTLGTGLNPQGINLGGNTTISINFVPSGSLNSLIHLPFGSVVATGHNVGYTLVQAGTNIPFDINGTYSLVSEDQGFSPSGETSFVTNPQSGVSYLFGNDGVNYTVTISGGNNSSQWGNAAGGNWSGNGNWTNLVHPNAIGDVATFGSAISSNQTVTLDGNETVGNIYFNNTNSAYNIALGSGSLTLDNGVGNTTATATSNITDLSGNHTIAVPMNVNSLNLNLIVTGATDSLTISQPISGATGNVTYSGAGKLVLGGNNTFSGKLLITGNGNVVLSGSEATATVLSITGNANVALSGSNAFTGISKGGTGTMTVSVANTYTGATSLTGGVTQMVGSGTLGNGSAVTVTNSTLDLNSTSQTIGSLSGTNNGIVDAAVAGGNANVTTTLTVGGSNANTTFGAGTTSVIRNTTGRLAINKVGTGTLTLAGTNTYTGGTTLTGGAISVGSDSNLGSGVNSTNNATLNNGNLTFNGGSLWINNNAFTSFPVANANGTVLGRNVTWGAAGGGIGVSGSGTTFVMDRPMVGGGFTKTGPGLVAFTANYITTSPTVIAAGTLELGNAATSTSTFSTPSIVDNGILGFNRATSNYNVDGDISGTGGLTQFGAGTTTVTGNYTATGDITIGTGNITFASTANARQTPAVVLTMNSLSVGPASALDSTNHDLIIGNSNLTVVNTMIENGFGAGPGGSAITSSTALSSGNTFLVPLDAAALGITSWDSANVTQPNSVIIKYTYFGDATLDGAVDGNDFSVIAGSFGTTTLGIADIQDSWLVGDLNLDGIVDGNDFSVVAGNFGSSPLANAPSMSAASPSQVPEPASLFLLGLGSAGMLIKRKRRTM